MEKKYGTGPNDQQQEKKRGDRRFIFGLKIQNNYEEIKNELKARRKK